MRIACLSTDLGVPEAGAKGTSARLRGLVEARAGRRDEARVHPGEERVLRAARGLELDFPSPPLENQFPRGDRGHAYSSLS